MRRKSTRNAVAKQSPEKVKDEKKKPRRTTRRHKPSSSDSDSDDEPLQHPTVTEIKADDDNNSDDNTRIRSSRRTRNKSMSHDEDDEKTTTRRTRRRAMSPKIVEEEEEDDEKKGKGKSKGKNKSKLDQSSRVCETEMQSEISENVQVTAQSPHSVANIDDVDKRHSECDKTDDAETRHNDDNNTLNKIQPVSESHDSENNVHNETSIANDKESESNNVEEQQNNETKSKDNQAVENEDSEKSVAISEVVTESNQEVKNSDEETKVVCEEPMILQIKPNEDVGIKTPLLEDSAANNEEIEEATNKEPKEEVPSNEESIKVVDSSNEEIIKNKEPLKVVESSNEETLNNKDLSKDEDLKVSESSNDIQVSKEEDLKVAESLSEIQVPANEVQDSTNEEASKVVESPSKEASIKVSTNEETIDSTNEETIHPPIEEGKVADTIAEDSSKIDDSLKEEKVVASSNEEIEQENEEVTNETATTKVLKETESSSKEELVPNEEAIESVSKQQKSSSISNEEDTTERIKEFEEPNTPPRKSLEKLEVSSDILKLNETSDFEMTISEPPIEFKEPKLQEIKVPKPQEIKEPKVQEIKEPKPQEIKEVKPQEIKEPKPLKKLKLSVKKIPKRSRKWGKTNYLDNNLLEISTDVLVELYPQLNLIEENEVKLDFPKERRPSEQEITRKVSVDEKSSDETQEEEKRDVDNIIAMNRKISIVDDDASKLKPPPSPAKNDKSDILFITNLVRPFTIKQLKELLERTGIIKVDGFWTDRIKSKCYVHYESAEEAEATRNALHGVHWPIGNGKKLMIDYASSEDLELARNPPPPPVVVVPVKPEVPEKENLEPEQPVEKRARKESEVETEWEKKIKSTQENWESNKRKEDLHIRRSRSKDRIDKRRHSRSRHSRSPSHDAKRKQKKTDEIPQRAMDDLFKKTEATPCIYWQPLSPDEISLKQQQRLERMAEHKRRMETQTRVKRGPEHPRGGQGVPYRRRY